jgi:tetratricopeptide (TPR) repeat protein
VTGRERIIARIVVAATAIVVYANSLLNGFALDDVFIVQNNARVHQLAHQGAIWLTPYWPGYGTQLGLYRPLTIFSFAIEWAVGGGAPWVFHGVNILLHALVSLLVLALLGRIVARPAALAGALLFAVHPLHTEAVANIVGQAELLAAAAVIGACVLYAARPLDATRPDARRGIAILVIFALGMLAKEGAVVLPGLLVALDAAQGRLGRTREHAGRYVRRALPFMAAIVLVVIAYLALRVHVLGSIAGVDAAPNLQFLRGQPRLLSALRAWPEYLRLLFFPIDLSADYSPGVILPVTGLTPMALLGAFILLVTIALALMTPVRRAGLAAAWFLIAVFPVSNLLLPIGVLIAERILYLPSVAASLALAFAWEALPAGMSARGRRIGAAAAAAVLVLFAGLSALRNPDWKNTNAVWDALVQDHPESYRAQWINGARMWSAGRKDLAGSYWELSYRIWPGDPELLNQLAVYRMDRGDYPRAIALLDSSRAITPWVSRTEILLAYASLASDRFEEARAALDRAEALQAAPATVNALRAQASEGLGDLDTAIAEWHTALGAPLGRQWTFYAALARDLALVGRTAEARVALDSARARTGAPAALADLARLDSAIVRGCHDAGASRTPSTPAPALASCTEPLAHWGIIIPDPQSEIAKDLQNATDAPVQGRDAGTGDVDPNLYK